MSKKQSRVWPSNPDNAKTYYGIGESALSLAKEMLKQAKGSDAATITLCVHFGNEAATQPFEATMTVVN